MNKIEVALIAYSAIISIVIFYRLYVDYIISRELKKEQLKKQQYSGYRYRYSVHVCKGIWHTFDDEAKRYLDER